MKIFHSLFTAIITVTLAGSISAQESSADAGTTTAGKLVTKEDSLSYALSILNYGSLIRQNIDPDPDIFARAMKDYREGKQLMTDIKAREFVFAYVNEMQARQAELEREKNSEYIAANEAFLVKNGLRPEVKTTASGLQFEIVKPGSGAYPARESTVKVHYSGKLIDGTEFDSSIKRNTPAEFPLSGVISGWTEGLQLMQPGAKFIFYIPEKLGYGAQGAGNVIKPFSTLIFEVELLEIVK